MYFPIKDQKLSDVSVYVVVKLFLHFSFFIPSPLLLPFNVFLVYLATWKVFIIFQVAHVKLDNK